MKYQRFEALVLLVGAAAIAASVVFSYGAVPVAEEVTAQLLLLAVLFAALHWGRMGGFISAMLASAAYLALRVPLIAQSGFNVELASLLLVRIMTYGLIGIVGGELCMRIKYIFARLEGSSAIDEWTGIYNQRHMTDALEKACAQFVRYDTPYALVLLRLSPALTDGLRVGKQRAVARAISRHLRSDVRLVDEAGRLEDGTFCVLLPHTGRAGALVVAERLAAGARDVLGAKDESVTVEVLGTPEDAARLVELRSRLAATSAVETADARATVLD